jgi:hypothetical protein
VNFFNELAIQLRIDFGRIAHRTHKRAAARPKRMNAINVISPHKRHGIWVFDDARVGLVQEPFVSGADTWIDRVVADIPNADNGCTLIFSSTPFPGHQYRLDWRRAEAGGNWYYSADLDMEGWLCPALFRYFFRRASVPLRPDKGSDLVLFFILHPNGEAWRAIPRQNQFLRPLGGKSPLIRAHAIWRPVISETLASSSSPSTFPVVRSIK